MGMSGDIVKGLLSIIRTEGKVTNLTEAVKSQQKKIETLSERLIALEVARHEDAIQAQQLLIQNLSDRLLVLETTRQEETMRAQRALIQNLSDRLVRLEATLDLLMRSGGAFMAGHRDGPALPVLDHKTGPTV